MEDKIDSYYYISHCVNCEPNILKRQNCNDSLDEKRILNGECYRTKKQAEKALKKYKEEWLKNHKSLFMEDKWKKI